MSLFQKMNPFSRPSSRFSSHHPRESTDLPRPSSSLDPHPHPHPVMNERYATPTPPPHPESPSTTHKSRTPSILRTLAHHPSLGALRRKKSGGFSTSTKKSKKKQRAAMKGHDAEGNLADRHSLKGSISVPEDLRRRSSSQSPDFSIPPLPELRPQYHHTTRPPYNRAASSTPSIIVQQHDLDLGTPESVRIKRFKLEFEMESPSTRRNRNRSASVGVPSSPEKWSNHSRKSFESRSPSLRHRSSPAHPSFGRPMSPTPPSAFSRSLTPGPGPKSGSISNPFLTTQHPHPVPLERHQSDFIPLTNSGRTQEYDDAFDILVQQEELPSGTPGGRKADLRKGALLDGARRERDAIRFFSRDTYSHQHSTPHDPTAQSRQPSSTFSSNSQEAQPQRRTTAHSRRSSSPFEVKLTPNVSKRVSLDAFGGAPKDTNEEILDDTPGDEHEGGDSDDHTHHNRSEAGQCDAQIDFSDSGRIPENSLSCFQGTTLSTIKESPSSRNDSAEQPSPASPVALGTAQKTQYFTPSSPVGSPRGSSHSPSRRSPFVPPRHISAPPTALNDLLVAHQDNAKAMHIELKASEAVAEELQAECRCLQHALEVESESKRGVLLDIASWQVAVMDLESTIDEKDAAISQLREALAENEEEFDRLHHEYHETLQRLASMAANRDDLLHLLSALEADLVASSGAQQSLQTEVDSLQNAMDEMTLEKSIAAIALNDAKYQLDRANEALATAEADSKSLENQIRALHLETNEKDAQITSLKDKIRNARFEANEKRFESEAAIARLQKELVDKEEEVEEYQVEMDRINQAAEEVLVERDELLDLLQNAANEVEEIPELRTTISALQNELQAAEGSMDSMKRAELQQSGDTQIIAELRAQVADEEEHRMVAKRQADDSLRTVQELRQELADVKDQMEQQSDAYELALITAETEKARSEDVRSRLGAFTTELDKARMSEAELREEVLRLRGKSATDELSRVELEKRVEQLIQDKELLNIALESKQTELILAQRRTRAAPTTPTRSSMASSTSKILRTPSAVDEFPRPLSSSLSTTKSSRRESSVIHNSVRRPAPLGTSTQHNEPRNSGTTPTVTKVVISTSPSKSKIPPPSAPLPGLTRRASLPTLVRKPSTATMRRTHGRVSSVAEVNEDVF